MQRAEEGFAHEVQRSTEYKCRGNKVRHRAYREGVRYGVRSTPYSVFYSVRRRSWSIRSLPIPNHATTPPCHHATMPPQIRSNDRDLFRTVFVIERTRELIIGQRQASDVRRLRIGFGPRTAEISLVHRF